MCGWVGERCTPWARNAFFVIKYTESPNDGGVEGGSRSSPSSTSENHLPPTHPKSKGVNRSLINPSIYRRGGGERMRKQFFLKRKKSTDT